MDGKGFGMKKATKKASPALADLGMKGGLEDVKIDEYPAVREAVELHRRIHADLTKAESELESARLACSRPHEQPAGAVDVYLAGGEVPPHEDELGKARFRKASEKVRFLRRALDEQRAREATARRAARAALVPHVWPRFASSERRVILALGELASALDDQRKLMGDLERRGWDVRSLLRAEMVRALKVESVQDAADAQSILSPSFLGDLSWRNNDVRRYLLRAAEALGQELPTPELEAGR